MSIKAIKQFMTDNYLPPQGLTYYKGRTVKVGQRVKVYRNLHNDQFSIVDMATGHVVAHSPTVALEGAQFIVRETGRQKVLRDKHKNVHAFIVGTFVGVAGSTLAHEAYYNPYKVATFVTPQGEPLYKADRVVLTDKRVYYSITE